MKALNSYVLVEHIEEQKAKQVVLTVAADKKFITKGKVVQSNIECLKVNDVIYYPAEVDLPIKDNLYAVNFDYVVCKE